MASFLELFDRDRERLEASLSGKRSPEEMIPVLEDECDRLLLCCSQQDDRAHSASDAAPLLLVLKASLSFLTCSGEMRIWELKDGSEKEKKKKRSALPLFGALALLLGILVFAAGEKSTIFILPGAILGAAGGVLLFLSGKRQGTDRDTELRAETDMDTGAVLGAFRASLACVDAQIEEAGREKKETEILQKDPGDVEQPKEVLTLYAQLLAAADAGDGQEALDLAENLRFLLHKKGVEAVYYKPSGNRMDQGALFDIMPAEKEITIRPALVSGNRVLIRGIAGSP